MFRAWGQCGGRGWVSAVAFAILPPGAAVPPVLSGWLAQSAAPVVQQRRSRQISRLCLTARSGPGQAADFPRGTRLSALMVERVNEGTGQHRARLGAFVASGGRLGEPPKP